MTGINDQGGFTVEGRPDPPPGTQGPHANRPHVSPGYFDAMGIRLVSGRLIDERDRQDTLPVAVVSDVAVRMYWSGQSPIGRRLAIEWADGRPVWRQIVGVVQGTRHFGPEAPQKAEIYVPVAQAPVPYMTLVVRTQGDPMALVSAVRGQIAAIDPEQSAFWFQTMEELVAKSTARRQFQTALVTTFALLALLLAGIGVYGVMGYMVAQRRREIGVRLALGAKPRDVIAMVLGNGLWLTLAGVVAGMAGALALSRVLAGFVYGVSPLDPATYAGAVAVLVAVAALSAYWPSRKAARLIRSSCCATNEWGRHSHVRGAQISNDNRSHVVALLTVLRKGIELLEQMVENCRRAGRLLLLHRVEDARVPEFLTRITCPAQCLGDPVAEHDQRVARRHRQRLLLVRRIGKEAERSPPCGEVPSGLVVHEDRAALSGIAVRQSIVGSDDAAEQRNEPGWDCPPAQRAVQTGHHGRRSGVHFGLDGQDALHDGRLQRCRCSLPTDIAQHHTEPALGVLIVEEVPPEGPAGTRPGRHIDVESGVARGRQ